MVNNIVCINSTKASIQGSVLSNYDDHRGSVNFSTNRGSVNFSTNSRTQSVRLL